MDFLLEGVSAKETDRMKLVKALIATIILSLGLGAVFTTASAASKPDLDIHARQVNSMSGDQKLGARVRIYNHDNRDYDSRFKVFKKDSKGVFHELDKYKFTGDYFPAKYNTLFRLDYKFFFNKKPGTYKIRYAIFYKGKHLSTITSNEFKVVK